MGNTVQSSKQSNRFILEHNQLNTNKINDLSLLDQKRVVFISLNGLYKTFDNCPSIILYSAICLMPLRREWIYKPTKHMNEIKQRPEVNALFDKQPKTQSKRSKRFFDLLKWKDEQGLVFWMLDEELYSNVNIECKQSEIVSPFWYCFSEKLASLYDPLTGNNYNPIIFDTTFWREIYNVNSDCLSKYEVKSHSVFAELYCLQLSMKYKTLQEIIYQSNPKSLNPLISYSVDQKSKSEFVKTTMNGDNGWVIANDYQ